MYEVGRLCVKIAGRDAGKKCVIVDVLKDNYVMIDGTTRRRKCNTAHLEPLDKVIKIKKNASHADVVKEFKKLKIEVKTTKPKKAASRPKKVRKKEAEAKKEPVKKEVKKKPAKTETKKKK
ncbi:50S ribosomal protein L14e [Candidatus Woesearchaeota archaeon]|jgi:large subunit ribosomal protein L14e|nr:50S ribosomal protein L14e [Candidatus Woesearchaeota archaeon]